MSSASLYSADISATIMSGKLVLLLCAIIGAAVANYEVQSRNTLDLMFESFDKTDDAVTYDQLTAFYSAYQIADGDFFLTEEDFCTGDKSFMADFKVKRDACGAYFKLLDITVIVDENPIIESIDAADIDLTYLVADEDGDLALNVTEWDNMYGFLRPLPFGVLHANYRNFDGLGLYDDFIASLGWVALYSDIAQGSLVYTNESMIDFWVGKGLGNEDTALALFTLFDLNRDDVVDPDEWETVFGILDSENDRVIYFHFFAYFMDAAVNPSYKGKTLQEVRDNTDLLKNLKSQLRNH